MLIAGKHLCKQILNNWRIRILHPAKADASVSAAAVDVWAGLLSLLYFT